jgi:Flp pilus assembly protein TadG
MSTDVEPREHSREGMAGILARFRASRSGNVAIIFALSAVVLLLAIGAAVDVGRWLHARDQTSAAIDAAVLAGGRILQTSNSKDTAGAIAAAEKYYRENVTSRLPVIDDSVTFVTANNGKAVTGTGTAYIETPFLRFANISKLPLHSTSDAEFSRSEVKIGKKEVSVMLDVTGSMKGQKLADLKDAAKKLVEILLVGDSVKVALVPFSEDIRLPTTSALNLARGTGLTNCKRLKNGNSNSCNKNVSGSTDYFLSPCVVERSGNDKYTDAAPGSGKYVMAHYSDDTTGSGSNKQGKCVIPSGSEVVPLSTDKNALDAKINGLDDNGGTAGHLGTAWAWYTLSPNWNSLWPSNGAQPYGTQDLSKVAILMTDGEYNTEYDKNGVRVGSSDAGGAVNDTSAKQAAALCEAMKTKGIEVWTIGFDLGSSWSSSYQMMKKCASDEEKFYPAATGEELKLAFQDIGLKLSQLHLSK